MALTTLGFLSGTLFGALALGDLIRPPAELAAGVKGAHAVAQTPSDRDTTDVVQAPGEDSARAEGAPVTTKTPREDPPIAAAPTAWQAVEARLTDLQTRLAKVEQALAERSLARPSTRPKVPEGFEERRDLLVSAGVSPGLAEDALWRESQTELDRLNLRDQAIREGWVGSDRYHEATRALEEEGGSLRGEIGDPAWDRYLYLRGEDNRLSILSVIPGSAAEAAGLQSDDLIESYAGTQPFGAPELRQATTAGEKGELVPERVRRGDRVLDVWIPRGPLGVRLGTARAEPLP